MSTSARSSRVAGHDARARIQREEHGKGRANCRFFFSLQARYRCYKPMAGDFPLTDADDTLLSLQILLGGADMHTDCVKFSRIWPALGLNHASSSRREPHTDKRRLRVPLRIQGMIVLTGPCAHVISWLAYHYHYSPLYSIITRDLHYRRPSQTRLQQIHSC